MSRKLHSNRIDIFVKTLNGKTITIETEANASLCSIKQAVHEKARIPTHEQILTFGGRPLMNDYASIHSYGISADCTLHLSLRLLSKASAVTIKSHAGNEQHILFTPNTTIRDIKHKCVMDSSVTHWNMTDINFIHQQQLLTDNNMIVARIPGIWHDSVFHTVITGDTYHGSTSIRWHLSPNKNESSTYVQKMSNIEFEKPIDELVRAYFATATDLHPFFTSTQCPIGSICIHYGNTVIKLILQKVDYEYVTILEDYRSILGIIAKDLSLSSFTKHFAECSCCLTKAALPQKEIFRNRYKVYRKSKSDEDSLKRGVIMIDITLADTCFIFNECFFYLDASFYERYKYDEKQRHQDVHFQFHPLVIEEELLIYGYIRNNHGVVPLEIIQLIRLLFPKYYGGQYEVSQHNEELSLKYNLKTNVFTINDLRFHLQFTSRNQQPSLVIDKSQTEFKDCDVLLLCQTQCKETKQSYTRFIRLISSARVKPCDLYLKFDKSCLESLICNIQILRIISDTTTIYRYPSKLTNNGYLLEWNVDHTKSALIFDNSKTEYYRSFESEIFYDLFLLRLTIKVSNIINTTICGI